MWRCSTCSAVLDDHREFLTRLGASSLSSSQAIVVLFALGYDLAGEEARDSLLDFLRTLSRLDLGLGDYEDFLRFRTTWSIRLVLLLRSTLLSSFSIVRSANADRKSVV